MCQLHISLIRAAQIYLELHFSVELHTKKALHNAPSDPFAHPLDAISDSALALSGPSGCMVHMRLDQC